MKVDYLGSRAELLRLLQTPKAAATQRPDEAHSFGKLIGDIDPNNTKLQENPNANATPRSGETAPPEGQVILEKGPMARYNFEAPPLLTPSLQPNEFPMDPDGGVKTPTVLSVTRRQSTEPDPESLALQPRAERVQQVGKMVHEASKAKGVDPALGMAVVAAESSFNPNALSKDGHYSKGLFQLLDSTAKTILKREGKSEEEMDLYDPKQNIELGTSYLRYLHDLFNNETPLPNNARSFATANSADLEKLAVAAFNAGEGRVASAQERAGRAGLDPTLYRDVAPYLPETTQDYVQRVFSFRPQFENFLDDSQAL